jgi:DNA repair exonuclease SbcCD nuclease subunit
MKIAILGDVHFGARGDSATFHKHFERFYREVFFPYLEKHNIEHVIQLGDVFDRRKFINFQTLHSCKQYFFDPINSKHKTWMIVGNHDTYYKNTNQVNSLELLLTQYNNINQIHKPFETSFNGTSILFVPWICQENRDEVMDAIRMSKSQVLIGHFEINGYEMYKGMYCEEGLEPGIFDKFDLVISGHFHTKSSRGNIIYTGTPYEMTWSDFDDPKGFHIFDATTRELEFIVNPNPIFHKIWYDDSISSMDEVLGIEFNRYKDCIVKVIIKNKLNTTWFDMFIEKLQQAGTNELQVVEDHLNLNLEDDNDIISEAEDTLTILNRYIGQLELKTDKGKLEELFRELYNEAISLE